MTDKPSRLSRLLWSWLRPQSVSLEWLAQHEAAARDEFEGVCWPWPLQRDNDRPSAVEVK